MPHLVRLHIDKAPITDAGLNHLPKPERLVELTLYNTQVGDGFVRRLKGAKRLEVLELYKSNVTDDGLAELNGITTLLSLDLRGTRTGDRALAAFADCNGLVLLDVGTLTTDAGLRQFKSLKKLDQLVIDKARVSGEAFRSLDLTPADMVAVRDGDVGDDDLPTLVRAAADVRVLNVKGNSITDAGLAHFKELRKTQILILNENPIRGRSLGELASLRGIAWLSLRGCPLEDPDLESLKPLYTGPSTGMNLTLAGTPIGDADLAKISGFSNLTHLDLSETKLTDEGLPHLYPLKLAVLDLRGTNVTAQGVAQLKQATRGVMIAWEGDARPAGWPW